MVCLLALGLSQNYYLSLAIRLLHGLHYNREFLNFFWAFLAGVFSINIESYELSCKRVVQFVNGYSKPH